MSKRHEGSGLRRHGFVPAALLTLLCGVRATPLAAQADTRSMTGLSLDSLLNVRIFVLADIGRGDEVGAMLAQPGAAILYLMPLRAVDVAAVARAAHTAKLVTVSAIPDYMRYPVCIGFDQRGNRRRILVNLTAARSAGADFEASLLQRVEVLNQ